MLCAQGGPFRPAGPSARAVCQDRSRVGTRGHPCRSFVSLQHPSVLSKSSRDNFILPSSHDRLFFLCQSATMSSMVDSLLSPSAKGNNSRALLRVIILVLIAAAAVSSRLFSVIRKLNLNTMI